MLTVLVTTSVAADTLGTAPSSRPFDSVSFGAPAGLTATDADAPVAPIAVTMTAPLAGAAAAVVDGRMDALSTFNGLELGAVEANPVMAGIAFNRKAMFAVKAGVTAASILVAERLWKKSGGLGGTARAHAGRRASCARTAPAQGAHTQKTQADPLDSISYWVS